MQHAEKETTHYKSEHTPKQHIQYTIHVNLGYSSMLREKETTKWGLKQIRNSEETTKTQYMDP